MTIVLTVLCLFGLGGSGCALFRWGDMSYEEREKRNSEAKDPQEPWIKPATSSGDWGTGKR